MNEIVTVRSTIKSPLAKVWQLWSSPEHIMKWNSASPEWHTPSAENDLRTGGKFSSRMEARDGSMGFDFNGVYDEVKDQELINYTLGDGRKVTISFSGNETETTIIQNFEAEKTNPVEMQKAGWQSIMNNFKSYAEEQI